VRLWREPAQTFLDAGVNLAPLAPLAKVTRKDLPGLLRRIAARFQTEPEPRAEKLRLATYVLMGLRYSDELVDQLTEGVWDMQESTTYQKILREGRQKGMEEGMEKGREEGREEGMEKGRIVEARRMLLRMGRQRFGEPDAKTVTVLNQLQVVEQIEALGDKILDSEIRDWHALLRAHQNT
jgi:predicted transposase YdaD